MGSFRPPLLCAFIFGCVLLVACQIDEDGEFTPKYQGIFIQAAIGDGFICATGYQDMGPRRTIYCAGAAEAGQTGNGTTSFTEDLVPVASSHDFIQVAAGARHACGLTGWGGVLCWGDNSAGQLGVPTTGPSPVPLLTPHLAWARQVTAAGESTCVLHRNFEVTCRGRIRVTEGRRRLLGDVPVTGSLPVEKILHSEANLCVLDALGEVLCLLAPGVEPEGGAVDLPGESAASLVLSHRVTAGEGTGPVLDACVARDYYCLLMESGDLRCAGRTFGVDPALSPPVSTASAVVTMTCTERELCLVSEDLRTRCLSTRAEASDPLPVPRLVPGSHAFSALFGGGEAFCGLETGSLWCWGEAFPGVCRAADDPPGCGNSGPAYRKPGRLPEEPPVNPLATCGDGLLQTGEQCEPSQEPLPCPGGFAGDVFCVNCAWHYDSCLETRPYVMPWGSGQKTPAMALLGTNVLQSASFDTEFGGSSGLVMSVDPIRGTLSWQVHLIDDGEVTPVSIRVEPEHVQVHYLVSLAPGVVLLKVARTDLDGIVLETGLLVHELCATCVFSSIQFDGAGRLYLFTRAQAAQGTGALQIDVFSSAGAHETVIALKPYTDVRVAQDGTFLALGAGSHFELPLGPSLLFTLDAAGNETGCRVLTELFNSQHLVQDPNGGWWVVGTIWVDNPFYEYFVLRPRFCHIPAEGEVVCHNPNPGVLKRHIIPSTFAFDGLGRIWATGTTHPTGMIFNDKKFHFFLALERRTGASRYYFRHIPVEPENGYSLFYYSGMMWSAALGDFDSPSQTWTCARAAQSL